MGGNGGNVEVGPDHYWGLPARLRLRTGLAGRRQETGLKRHRGTVVRQRQKFVMHRPVRCFGPTCGIWFLVSGTPTDERGSDCGVLQTNR